MANKFKGLEYKDMFTTLSNGVVASTAVNLILRKRSIIQLVLGISRWREPRLIKSNL